MKRTTKAALTLALLSPLLADVGLARNESLAWLAPSRRPTWSSSRSMSDAESLTASQLFYKASFDWYSPELRSGRRLSSL